MEPHVQIWRFADGLAAIDLDGIIVCSVPLIVEEKHNGLTLALAQAVENFAASTKETDNGSS